MTLAKRFGKLAASREGRRLLAVSFARLEPLAKLGARRGKARGGGQSSKAKGRSAVLAVRDLLVEHCGIPVTGMVVKATSMPGEDLYIAPEHRVRCPWAIEVKNVEALNIWQALAQASANADGRTPIVFFKRAKTPLFVALLAVDFLKSVSHE